MDHNSQLVCDLEHYDKNLRKVKDTTKTLNEAIISQREKERYLEAFGKLPEEKDYLDWVYPRTKESREYVKKLTESNPTHTAKRPSRSKKEVQPPKHKEPWKPPAH